MGEFIASNGPPEGSPILSSGSFSDLIKAVLSTKSSNFCTNMATIKLCWIKSHWLQILKQDKTVTVKIVKSLHCNIPPDQTMKTFS